LAWNKIREYALISLSAVLTAIAVNFFYSEHALAPGGITGMSIIVSALTGLEVQYVTLAISGPLLVLAVIFLGKNFGLKTLYITLLTPLCMKLMPQLHVTGSIILAAIAGGFCVGTAIGIAVSNGCATGGTDTMALLIQRLCRKLKLPAILFILDGTVVVLSGVISKDVKVPFYSLLSLLVIMYTIRGVSGLFQKRSQTGSQPESTVSR